MSTTIAAATRTTHAHSVLVWVLLTVALVALLAAACVGLIVTGGRKTPPRSP